MSINAPVLGHSTIVPRSLYVKRAADRQLAAIVSEMGRPGYILVARQMGKTNLLLNMKREQEAEGKLVYYFDLSNRFDTARSFFRNVIDTILESLEEHYPDLASEIRASRSPDVEANVEYDRHLRRILRLLERDILVIVFDEVDSLVSSTYSDKVLAQVRSMYFARGSHPDYERLTYVLSGVAEPSDLIKDKNISPFNIGAKIYLSDFSREESDWFLERTALAGNSEVADRIYYWVSGNPRMTWDIASDLEQVQQARLFLQLSDVDDAVKRLYLTRFDHAPIDHIRELVERDYAIRDALVEVRYGKGEDLDDKTKSRLYLAGITSGEVENPRIKNRVIEAALSEGWLEQKESGPKALLDVASRRFLDHDHAGVIAALEEYERSEGTAPLPALAQMQLGIAKQYQGDFAEAVVALRKAAALSDLTPELETSVCYHLGTALLSSGQARESVEAFRRVVSLGGSLARSAKLTIGSAYLAIGDRSRAPEIIRINEEVIEEETQQDRGRERGVSEEILTSAYFNSAQAAVWLEDREAALEYLSRSLEAAPAKLRPAILLFRIQIAGAASEKSADALLAAKTVLENRLDIERPSASHLHFKESTLATVLAELYRADESEAANEFISHLRTRRLYRDVPEGELLLRLFNAAEKDDEVRLTPILVHLVRSETFELIPDGLQVDAIRKLALYSTDQLRAFAINLYINRLNSGGLDSDKFESDDLLILVTHLNDLVSSRSWAEALKVAGLARRYQEPGLRSSWPLFVFLLSLEMNVKTSLHDIAGSHEVAKEILAIFRTQDDRQADVETEYGPLLRHARRAAESTLRTAAPDPYRAIGRNQLVRIRDVASGEEFTTKFKKVEAEIRSGRYKLV